MIIGAGPAGILILKIFLRLLLRNPQARPIVVFKKVERNIQ
jgi:uncharacterized NAD(P)/FAD-binding protein YdhS